MGGGFPCLLARVVLLGGKRIIRNAWSPSQEEFVFQQTFYKCFTYKVFPKLLTKELGGGGGGFGPYWPLP